MGRVSSGVKGIKLGKDDELVGMVVAREVATLLTVCAHGYGKRTPFGDYATAADGADAESDAETNGDAAPPSQRYPLQRRGGKGVRDIKTTKRNGPVVGVASVTDEDELLMITARGKLQRVASSEISVIGRNTQGVRIMNVDEGDELAAIVRVPRDADEDDAPTDEAENGAPAARADSDVAEPGGPETDAGDGEGGDASFDAAA